MVERVRLLGIAGALPATSRSSADVEKIVLERSGGFQPRMGLIEASTGVRRRRVAAEMTTVH